MTHRSDARFRGVAYDHLVTLYNGCDVAATCTVRTNVNPTPISANLAPGTRTTLLTYRGSPARSFVAQVECGLDR